MSDETKAAIVPSGHNAPDRPLSPTQRWGTCCPFDPECDHSFMDDRELDRWMRTPITDEHANQIAGGYV